MTDPTVRPATPNQLRAELLLEDLWKDPEFGPKLRVKAKAKFNDIQIPEDLVEPALVDIRKQNETLQAQLGAVVEKLNKREEKEAEERTFREMEASVNAAVNKYGLTEEGRGRMLDRMKETKAFDVEAAAAFVAHATPPAPTSGPSWAPQKANFYGSADADKAFEKLHRDPIGYMDDELNQFVRDPDKYTAETFGRAA